MSMTMRPYAGEDDYAPLRRLFDAAAGASSLHYGTAGDLDWWRFAHEDPAALRHTTLWCAADGTIVGFAWPERDEVAILAHPAHRELERVILAWAEALAASQSPPEPLLAARSFDEDAPRVALLRARGYARTEQAYRYRSRPLTGDLPERVVPPGFSVRALGGDDELAVRVAVHRAAFAPSRMTVAKHRAVRTAPGYRPDLRSSGRHAGGHLRGVLPRLVRRDQSPRGLRAGRGRSGMAAARAGAGGLDRGAPPPPGARRDDRLCD